MPLQLAVLEVRSKSWGRVAPAAAKGRSQSAPRGVPRRAVPPQRAQSDTAADRVPILFQLLLPDCLCT